jgi:hypothetical protein
METASHLIDYGPLPKYCAYIDESGHSKDPNRDFVCLAGLLALSAAWKKFELGWTSALKTHRLTEPFHMADFAGFRGQFKNWTDGSRKALLGTLLDAIRSAGAIPFGSVVSTRDFDALDERSKSRLRDPYMVAFQSLTYNIAVAAALADNPGLVTMTYAHHPEHSEGLANSRGLWLAVRKANHMVSFVMEAYESGTPRTCVQLQAADLWAYELGHHFDVIRPQKRQPRYGFERFVEIGLNYSLFAHNFITYRDKYGEHGLGKMARVQHWSEIKLYEPGYVARPFSMP